MPQPKLQLMWIAGLIMLQFIVTIIIIIIQMDKILTVPSNEVGDIIIQAYKDAGYKIKKPKGNKIKIETGNGLLEQIKHNYYCDSSKAR